MLAISDGQMLLDEIKRRYDMIPIGVDPAAGRDRRRSPRYELERGAVEVEIRPRGRGRAAGVLADVSLHGARIVSDYVPKTGEILPLLFKLDERYVAIHTEVRHVGREDAVRFFGVRFVEPTNGSGGDLTG